MDPNGVEMSLFSTAFWLPSWHTGEPVQGQQGPDLSAIVQALQDEVRGLREEVEGLRPLPQRVRVLEAQSAFVGTVPHRVTSEAVLEDFTAEDAVLGGKTGGVAREATSGHGAVDVVSNDQPREDGYDPADKTAAASRWRTEELEQSYELQGSMWDSTVYLGTTPCGAAGFLNPQPETLHAATYTLPPTPFTLDPQISTLNPAP